MSRSNPNANSPNPAQRWFEWNGEKGHVRYYDKDEKKNVDVPLPFKFLLLDEVASVGGWHDASGSGIYSNAVRDTRTDLLVVKSYKGGILAEGLYKDIKDHVTSKSIGGQFVANCYIAFKYDDGSLAIGCLRFKGSALGAWMEYRKQHRRDLYAKALEITGYDEGKKGRIVFRVPTFEARDISDQTNAIAVELDKELQAWLADYFNRRTSDRAEAPPQDEPETDATGYGGDLPESDNSQPLTDDDIPF
jgi:hypothetical protein